MLSAACAQLFVHSLSAQLASGVAVAAVAERAAGDEIPALLAGIWQGSDRLLLFGKEQGEFAAVLRVFYGWYADRAAEPASYAASAARERNNATAAEAEHVTVRYATIAENASRTAGAYELFVSYPGEKEPAVIPVAVIDGKLYLDFLVRGSAADTDFAQTLSAAPDTKGFWRDCGSMRGVQVSPPAGAAELSSYYISGDAVYRIRYWQTEMPYTYETARLADGGTDVLVDKYLCVAGVVYTCATGRRTVIRNIEKISALDGCTFDGDNAICARGAPYLTRVEGKDSRDDLQALVAEINARRHPAPPPPFPPVFPNIRWPDYDALDLYNPGTWNRRNIDIGK